MMKTRIQFKNTFVFIMVCLTVCLALGASFVKNESYAKYFSNTSGTAEGSVAKFVCDVKTGTDSLIFDESTESTPIVGIYKFNVSNYNTSGRTEVKYKLVVTVAVPDDIQVHSMKLATDHLYNDYEKQNNVEISIPYTYENGVYTFENSTWLDMSTNKNVQNFYAIELQSEVAGNYNISVNVTATQID